ncbi:uncharacterized protein LOC133312552 [Gastrolobium bilobum]|uniref:uncharacterized protein LOC133312552 n=1 Tax=Gastrolobium bilobum TaxID=150636 RepID=UPI002AB06B2F|nr:uncharacterized protein LOC133312552 [Gastrolobium bilobum]
MSTLPAMATDDDDMQEIMFAKRNCTCFWMPCFPSETSPSWWERVQTPENKERWWARGWKKVREWSEIVAGPKWKTFIRRFNNNNKTRGVSYVKHGSFNYDPLSYALNFDDGSVIGEEVYGYGGFSARFASVPASAKSSMDLGKDGAPTFT